MGDDVSRKSRSRSHTPFVLRSSCDKEICSINNQHERNETKTANGADDLETKSTVSSRSSSRLSAKTKQNSNVSSPIRRSSRRKHLSKSSSIIELVEVEVVDITGTETVNDDSSSRVSDNVSEASDISTVISSMQIGSDNDYGNRMIPNRNKKLDMYLRANEYWNEYPKTGYTYADENSKMMPNMSRRSITRSPTPHTTSATSQNKQFNQQQQHQYRETGRFKFIRRIFSAFLSLFESFLKFFYLLFLAAITFEISLFAKRNNSNVRKTIWKNIIVIVLVNLAFIAGLFMYSQLSLLSQAYNNLPSMTTDYLAVEPHVPKTTATVPNLDDRQTETINKLKIELNAIANRLDSLSDSLKVTKDTIVAEAVVLVKRAFNESEIIRKVSEAVVKKVRQDDNDGVRRAHEAIKRDLTSYIDRVIERNAVSSNSCCGCGNGNDVEGKYRIDYALKGFGARVIDICCTKTLPREKWTWFRLFSWFNYPDPNIILDYGIAPGSCFPFTGFPGKFIIRLATPVEITEFGLEHIRQDISMMPATTPQNFTVYGLEDRYDPFGYVLGSYVYNNRGPALQFFPLANKTNKQFEIVQLVIDSNYGHENYTCLYRFRVYGYGYGYNY